MLRFAVSKETKHLPDWGKMTFVQFPGKTSEEILPGVEAEQRDLVGKLVKYQSTERMNAEDVSHLLHCEREWKVKKRLADDGWCRC